MQLSNCYVIARPVRRLVVAIRIPVQEVPFTEPPLAVLFCHWKNRDAQESVPYKVGSMYEIRLL